VSPPVDPGDTASPLGAVDHWGARVAAAAAVDRTGAVHRHGDTGAVLPVASITKLATAMAALVALEEGAIELDEPAGPPGSTVRHLLCHASGLDFDSPRSLAEPGARRIYSNTGYEALADHLAERSGVPFETYLSEAVLEPLGMGSSRLAGSPAKDLRAPLEDLLALAAAWREPLLVHPSTLEVATSPVWPQLAGVLPGWGRREPCWWGLGPEVRGVVAPHWTGDSAAPATYGHFGGSGTLLWVDPVARVTCVAVCDRPFGDWALEAWPAFSDAVRAAYA
jgi:CubicO group peptidase (beta-lactamase class C family)